MADYHMLPIYCYAKCLEYYGKKIQFLNTSLSRHPDNDLIKVIRLDSVLYVYLNEIILKMKSFI